MEGRVAAAASAMAGRAAAPPGKALEMLRASRRDSAHPSQRGAVEAPPAKVAGPTSPAPRVRGVSPVTPPEKGKRSRSRSEQRLEDKRLQ
eukprot:7173179-Alexandrium_andersonii.AAC.1